MLSSFPSWLLISTLALVSAAFNGEYSGAHRSSPFVPSAHLAPIQKQQVFPIGGYGSSIAGSHGNLSPGHGYAYYSPQGSVAFSQKTNAPAHYAPQPGAYAPPFLHPHGYAPAPVADQPAPVYGSPALAYAPQAEQYAPAYVPQPEQYQPSYPAYAPAYAPAYTPGAAQPSYLPPYGQAPGLYSAGGSYAPAYSNGYPAEGPHFAHGPQYIAGPESSHLAPIPSVPGPAIKREVSSDVEKKSA